MRDNETAQAQEQHRRMMTTLVTGRRYFLLTVSATAIAVGSTYRKLTELGFVLGEQTAEETQQDAGNVLTMNAFLTELMHSRVSAAQTKETMIHFVLMRCLLLASTMGPAQEKTTVGLLLLWLSSVTFIRGLLSLCKARFEHLLTRPMSQMTDLHRLSAALGLVVILDLLLVLTCSFVSFFTPLVVHFAWFEASLLLLRALQLGVKVVFHMFDVGNSLDFGSENGEFYLLVLQTVLSGCYLVQLVWYYLYIISVDQFRVSFLDLILIINVKNATVQLLEKFKKVKMYHQVVMDLDQLFPNATQEELDAVADDVCVICLKPMDIQAKKLHCGHLFHRLCLRQCLQRASIGDAFTALDNMNRGMNGLGAMQGPTIANTSLRCPICRKHVHSGKIDTELQAPARNEATPAVPMTVGDNTPQQGTNQNREVPAPDAVATPREAPGNAVLPPETEEVLRISTEFLSRWIPFPNFSFEIVRHRDGSGIPAAAATPFVVTPAMIQQVWEVFPQHSMEDIHADLTLTRSPENTIERILNGRFDHDRQRRIEQNARAELDNLAATDDIDDDLRWNVSNIWNNMWNPPQSPRASRAAQTNRQNHDNLRNQHQEPRREMPTESLLARLQRWRTDGAAAHQHGE